MAIPATYRVEMSRALPGQVSDTSAYNIDGACVLDGDVNILVGVAVQHGGVDAMGNKLIKPMASDGSAYGVAAGWPGAGATAPAGPSRRRARQAQRQPG